jgi:hypothetical protein
MALIVACGLIFRLYRHEVAGEGVPAGFKIASFIEVAGRQGALLLAIGSSLPLRCCFPARAGRIAAAALGLLVFGTLSVRRRRGAAQDRREMIVLVAVLVAAVCRAGGGAGNGRREPHVRLPHHHGARSGIHPFSASATTPLPTCSRSTVTARSACTANG